MIERTLRVLGGVTAVLAAMAPMAAALSSGAAAPSSASAGAAVPEACAAGPDAAKSFETGRAQGENFVQSAWKRVQGDCSRVEEISRLLRQVLDARKLDDNASDTLRCRLSGFEAGANEALRAISAECR